MSWDLRPHLQSHVSVGEVNDGSHETTRAASWGGGDSIRGELSPCHPPKERRALRAEPRSGGSARRLGAPSTSFPLLPGLRTHRTQAGWLPDDKWQCQCETSHFPDVRLLPAGTAGEWHRPPALQDAGTQAAPHKPGSFSPCWGRNELAQTPRAFISRKLLLKATAHGRLLLARPQSGHGDSPTGREHQRGTGRRVSDAGLVPTARSCIPPRWDMAAASRPGHTAQELGAVEDLGDPLGTP